jgi:hypothetical protein
VGRKNAGGRGHKKADAASIMLTNNIQALNAVDENPARSGASNTALF